MIRRQRRQRPEGAHAALSDADVARIRGVLVLGGVPWEELDDAVQQVRLKLLEAQTRPGRDTVRNLRAWVAVVASRIATDWHRERMRDRRLAERLAATWPTQPASHEEEGSRILSIEVAGALDQMTPHHRQVLVLRYFSDLAVADIAELLGIPEGTVKSRLHHATAAMARQLTSLEVPDGASESIG